MLYHGKAPTTYQACIIESSTFVCPCIVWTIANFLSSSLLFIFRCVVSDKQGFSGYGQKGLDRSDDIHEKKTEILGREFAYICIT